MSEYEEKNSRNRKSQDRKKRDIDQYKGYYPTNILQYTAQTSLLSLNFLKR